jgi:ribosome biogenesis GTPase
LIWFRFLTAGVFASGFFVRADSTPVRIYLSTFNIYQEEPKLKMKKPKEINTTPDYNTQMFRAVVANINNKQAQVLFGGEIIPCLIPGSMLSNRNSLTVGDLVEIALSGNNQCKLVNVLSRNTSLYRGDRRSPGKEILIAANVQCLLIVVTADYLLNQSGFPESSIIAAERAGIESVLYVSKWDLIGERAQELLKDKLNLYRNFIPAVFTGEAKAELTAAVKGKTTVVIGDRGCGKTTLIREILNKLRGEGTERMIITGTHTGALHVGPEETFFIDTPGFREFALHEITEEERNFAFPEIASLAEDCHFSNCTHIHEEGCRITEALRTGNIRRDRYHAYQKMAESIPEGARRKSDTPKVNYQHRACTESFVCKVCGTLVVPDGAGSQHRNHCPKCLSSLHVDEEPGDRASLCNGIMDPVSVWVRKGGEWAIIHRCRLCGSFSSNRIAADDNPMLLMSIAVRPLSMPAFPLNDFASL